jgi:hypothetical protein
MNSILPPVAPAWHCALDREMRLVYLGIDKAESQTFGVEVFAGSAARMGDAIEKAVNAWGIAYRECRL